LLRPKQNTVAATLDVASEAMAEGDAGTAVDSDHMEDMAAVEAASVIMEAVVSVEAAASEVVAALAAAMEDVETTVAAAATVDMEVASADTVAMAEATATAEAVATVVAVAMVAAAAATTMAHNNVNPATTVTATPASAPIFNKVSATTPAPKTTTKSEECPTFASPQK